MSDTPTIDLSGPVEIVPLRMRRTEVQRPDGWTAVPFETIRIGDVFRMFESDGTPVDGGAVFECVSDPVPCEPGENWGMAVEEVK